MLDPLSFDQYAILLQFFFFLLPYFILVYGTEGNALKASP